MLTFGADIVNQMKSRPPMGSMGYRLRTGGKSIGQIARPGPGLVGLSRFNKREEIENDNRLWINPSVKFATGAGGLTFSGAGTVVKILNATDTGRITFAGAGTVIKNSVVVGTGAIRFVGVGTPHKTINIRLSIGAVVFAGAGAYSATFREVGHGGLQLVGIGQPSLTTRVIGAGRVTFAGAGDALKNATFVVGAGGVAFAGTGAVRQIYTITSAGAIIFGGTGSYHATVSEKGTGAITLSGSGQPTYSAHVTGAIGQSAITFAGAGLPQRTLFNVGSGSVRFVGAGIPHLDLVATSTGGGVQFVGAGKPKGLYHVDNDTAIIKFGGEGESIIGAFPDAFCAEIVFCQANAEIAIVCDTAKIELVPDLVEAEQLKC